MAEKDKVQKDNEEIRKMKAERGKLLQENIGKAFPKEKEAYLKETGKDWKQVKSHFVSKMKEKHPEKYREVWKETCAEFQKAHPEKEVSQGKDYKYNPRERWEIQNLILNDPRFQKINEREGFDLQTADYKQRAKQVALIYSENKGVLSKEYKGIVKKAQERAQLFNEKKNGERLQYQIVNFAKAYPDKFPIKEATPKNVIHDLEQEYDDKNYPVKLMQYAAKYPETLAQTKEPAMDKEGKPILNHDGSQSFVYKRDFDMTLINVTKDLMEHPERAEEYGKDHPEFKTQDITEVELRDFIMDPEVTSRESTKRKNLYRKLDKEFTDMDLEKNTRKRTAKFMQSEQGVQWKADKEREKAHKQLKALVSKENSKKKQNEMER